jgi:hypothetical protein
MTITDLVFPAFLFIVGIAIPFALGARLRRGHSRGALLRHVVTRALALVVMGVLMVNAEHGVGGVLSAPVWNVLMTLGVLLVWGTPDEGWGRLRTPWLRAVGATLLVFVALAYRSGTSTGLVQLRPYWWGILGLIGWAYLGVAALYLVIGDRPAILTGLIGLWLRRAGRRRRQLRLAAIPGPIGRPDRRTRRDRPRRGAPQRAAEASPGGGRLPGASWARCSGMPPRSQGLCTPHTRHPAFRVAKIGATLPWGLFSSALTCAALALLFVLVDVVGWRRWPRSLTIAGENPLIAYLMAPFLLSLFALSTPLFGGTNFYETLGGTTGIGLIRSAIFAWLVVRLSGWMRSRGVRIQL